MARGALEGKVLILIMAIDAGNLGPPVLHFCTVQ